MKLAFSALLTVALLSGCGSEPPQPPPTPTVGVVALTTGPATLTRELPGRISAVETSEVRPQISGIIRRRLFSEGAYVRAGQVLYQIEDAPYRAALGSAQGSLARAQAAIKATRLQAQRYRGLVAINAVSKQEADNAEAAAQQAVADVAVQKAAVDAARVNLEFTRIRAPISGRIGRSMFTAGRWSRPDRTMRWRPSSGRSRFTLMSASRLRRFLTLRKRSAPAGSPSRVTAARG